MNLPTHNLGGVWGGSCCFSLESNQLYLFFITMEINKIEKIENKNEE